MQEEKLDRYILEGEIINLKQKLEKLNKKIIPLRKKARVYKKQINWREKYLKAN